MDDYFEVSEIENVDSNASVFGSKNFSGILKKSINENHKDTKDGNLTILISS